MALRIRNIIKPILILFFSAPSILSSCHPFCNGGDYVLNAKAAFSPQMNSANIGDTLWYTVSFPSVQKIGNTSQTIDFSHADNVGTSISFGSVTDSNFYQPAVDSFDFKVINGILKDNPGAPHSYKDITCSEQNGEYRFAMAIILNKPGIYAITPIDFPALTKRCSKAQVSIEVTNSDKHTFLLEPYYRLQGIDVPKVERAYSYCFKVL